MWEWLANDLLTHLFQMLAVFYNFMIMGFEYANEQQAIQVIYVVFGTFSSAIFIVAFLFSFFRLNVNKLQGRGSYASFIEGGFYGILHTAFATVLLPTCFLLLSRLTIIFTNSYLTENKAQVTENFLRDTLEKNILAFLGGMQVFFVFFIFVCVITWFIIKVMMMTFENFGIIIVQTCIFAILVYDTILNEGVGTMRFFKVAIGTIIGQGLMMFFCIAGMVLMFQGDNFILGLSLIMVAPKMPTLVPSYLGATGRFMQSGKSFGLNMSMLKGAAQMAGGSVG